jgi:F-type H+-transporting ATPase subunit gamma
MANLKEIKRKISSVKNTQKTTKAMKLVSTAKLRRAEELAKQSRDYADKINDILKDISRSANRYKDSISSPLLEEKDSVKTIDIIFITADKGLCGGFNMQTIKRIKSLLVEHSDKVVRLKAVGRKGIDYFKFQGVELYDQKIGLSSSPNYDIASEFVNSSVSDYKDGKTDRVILIRNGFVNMLSQEIREINLLPVEASHDDGSKEESLLEIEPDDSMEILEELVSKYIEYNMYYSLIDSLAAEHSARMQAMDAASTNAKELVEQLTVDYNKRRQEAITTELIEIIRGMESLK